LVFRSLIAERIMAEAPVAVKGFSADAGCSISAVGLKPDQFGRGTFDKFHIKGAQCLRMKCPARLIFVLVCLSTLSALANQVDVSTCASPPDSWPQWRGPLANGVAPRANPPLHWSETNNIRWKMPLPGKGH